jgi:hypothetical protein
MNKQKWKQTTGTGCFIFIFKIFFFLIRRLTRTFGRFNAWLTARWNVDHYIPINNARQRTTLFASPPPIDDVISNCSGSCSKMETCNVINVRRNRNVITFGPRSIAPSSQSSGSNTLAGECRRRVLQNVFKFW